MQIIAKMMAKAWLKMIIMMTKLTKDFKKKMVSIMFGLLA